MLTKNLQVVQQGNSEAQMRNTSDTGKLPVEECFSDKENVGDMESFLDKEEFLGIGNYPDTSCR